MRKWCTYVSVCIFVCAEGGVGAAPMLRNPPGFPGPPTRITTGPAKRAQRGTQPPDSVPDLALTVVEYARLGCCRLAGARPTSFISRQRMRGVHTTVNGI